MKSTIAICTTAALATVCLVAANARPAISPAAPVPAGYAQSRDWDAPPPELDDVMRHGFHDGIEGARKDYDEKRRPDVNNRDEYKHPHVPERDREAYRRGFERGYQVGVAHLYHNHL